MAITYTDNGGGAPNGSDLEFTFTFPVLQNEDVKVALNGVTQATTKYAVDTASNPTKITFNNTDVDNSVQESNGAPKSGVRVRVYRETSVGKSTGDDDPKAVYASGSSIRAVDLNANTEQALYAIHELQDRPIETEDIQSSAVTSDKIADGTIVNADINVDAEIDGTKISPDFGSQNISTTGSITSGTLTVNNNVTLGNDANSDTVVFNSTIDSHLIPKNPHATGTYNLGSEIVKWNNIYTKGTIFANDLDVDGTTDLDTTNVDGTLTVGGEFVIDNVKINSNSVFTLSGDLTLDSAGGTVKVIDNFTVAENTVLGLTSADTLSIYAGVNTDLNPNASSSRSLGNNGKRWEDIYVDNIRGNAISTSSSYTANDATSNTKVYSAAQTEALFLRQDSIESLASNIAWTSNDTTVATTGAIDARVRGLITDVGGFRPIANEAAFPITNPDPDDNAGTIVSITALSDNRQASAGSGTPNTGVLTTGFTTETVSGEANSNAQVTITGCPNSQVFQAGFGLLVETTSTLNTYTFVRYLPDTSNVTTIAGHIDDIVDVADELGITNGITGDVTKVADDITKVTTVANDITKVTAVADELGTVNGITGDVTKVANKITQVEDVADKITKVEDVANKITKVEDVADDINKVTAVADELGTTNGITGDVTKVADQLGTEGAVTKVADISSQVSSVANDAIDIGNVANIKDAVTRVDGIRHNVTTVAGQISPDNHIATVANAKDDIEDVATEIANGNLSAAVNSATNAATSASNAATSESGALAQATTATEQAAIATTQASNASSTATLVQNLSDNFHGVYLGALTGDPAGDSVGNFVNAGDIYFDTTIKKFKVFNGSSFDIVGSVSRNFFASPQVANLGVFKKYAVLTDTKAAPNSGGSFLKNFWRVRDINTEQFDDDNITSISNNQFTLQAGTYFIKASALSSNVGDNQLRIYNATDTSELARGTVCQSIIDGANFTATVQARVTITAAKAFEIQHIASQDQSIYGFGVGLVGSGNFSTLTNNEDQDFLTVEIYKESDSNTTDTILGFKIIDIESNGTFDYDFGALTTTTGFEDEDTSNGKLVSLAEGSQTYNLTTTL